MIGTFHAFEFDNQTYRVFEPESPARGAILYLHGRGESGLDHHRMVNHGLGKAVQEHPDRWPFLIVMPQKPEAERLWPEFVEMLDGILSDVESRFAVPAGRALTGLSQGGHGTLNLIQSLRWKFRAAAAICGWADPREAAHRLHAVPTWLFHGAADPVVPSACSVAVHDWLSILGSEVRLTLYEGVEHNSWDLAYGSAELPMWLAECVNR